jgi:FHS family L-fucose permease-like MFS transporter
MHEQENEIVGDTGPLRKQYNLFLGVWSQFWYVGAQVAIAGYFINYCKESGKTAAQGCTSSPFSTDSQSHCQQNMNR